MKNTIGTPDLNHGTLVWLFCLVINKLRNNMKEKGYRYGY